MKQQSDETQLAVMAGSIKTIEEKVTNIDKQLRSDYVSNDKHQLTVEKVSRLEKVVYGFIGVILTAVAVALMAIVLKK